MIGDIGVFRYDEPGENVKVELRGWNYRLKRKSIKRYCDVVVCWKSSPMWVEVLNSEDVEVIDLQERLLELSVSW